MQSIGNDASPSAPDVELIRGGIDWFTGTYAGDGLAQRLWVERGLWVLDRIAEQGYDINTRTMQGYYGASAGNCFVGTRDDGSMIQLTGNHANDWFEYVYNSNIRVPRIDVQMTVKYTTMPNDIARRGYGSATDSNASLPVSRRRKLVLITGSDGGDTLYLGAPSSDQRGRIYNKEVQSEDSAYTRCWRYEVVYRNDLGTQLAASCPIEQGARAKWASDVAQQWFGARGVVSGGYSGVNAVILPIARTLPTDVERSLRWLEEQVAPTIKRLTEAGYGETIRTRLGME